jgi:Protein of unknown function (DUF3551)
MRTLFLALATSATIFATGVTPVAASEYRYCLQGDDYAGAGDCGFASDQQCQAAAWAARPTAGPILISRMPPS